MATNLKSIHLFAGAGGGILADLLLGHRPICAVEIERYPRDILLMRQEDGILPRFPVWDDVRTFRSDNPECARQFDAYRSIASELVICGGFPCQDISIAGKGAGSDGEQSGLWSEYARIVCEIRPRYVFVENSPMLTARGLGRVLGDLAALGYDAAWCVLGDRNIEGITVGYRLWILAIEANSPMLESMDFSKNLQPCSQKSRRRKLTRAISKMLSQDDYTKLKRDNNAVAVGMDRLKAIGNG